MTERITKLAAARRQLKFAIRVMFSGVDPLPVHTLVGAASTIISNLVDSERSWDRFAQESNALEPGEYFKIMREAQNFLKHAETDPDETFDFDPEHSDALAFWAVMNLGEMGPLSHEESTLQLWYLACYDPALEENASPWNEARELFGDLRGLPRSERLKKGLEVLNKYDQ